MKAENVIFAINAVRDKNPLIHCITNPISINQCACAVLAAGARPMMGEHPAEVAEITSTAGALLLNTANITDVRMESMLISAHTSSTKGIPFVLDPVGIACSRLRREYVIGLIKKYTPSVIKGNYSELMALYDSGYKSDGVDSVGNLQVGEMSVIARKLAAKYNTVILCSGKVDIVADKNCVIHIKNGSPQLTRITGTGCMLGALCACYLSVCDALSAATTACAVMGICGEIAQTDKGNGTFFVNLMDALSTVSDSDIQNYLKIEVFYFEKT